MNRLEGIDERVRLERAGDRTDDEAARPDDPRRDGLPGDTGNADSRNKDTRRADGRSADAWRNVFGPVPSRRLGRSLGVDPVPFKTCTFNCVYCQLGRTARPTCQRRSFFTADEIVDEVAQALDLLGHETDAVTIVGHGEPTLFTRLGELVRRIKKLTRLPVAVITNGSLLGRSSVRRDLLPADIVMPTLDTVDPDVFRRINRPHRRLRCEEIVAGLAAFRREFRGRLWLETMLVRDLNDGDEQLRALRLALGDIAPDRMILNVPVRPPAEAWVRPPAPERLARAREILGEALLMDRPESGVFPRPSPRRSRATLWSVLQRHPLRYDQVLSLLGDDTPESVADMLATWVREGRLQRLVYRGEAFYTSPQGVYGAA